MYTKEQEEMALREYERLGSVTAVIQRLGYPSESTLYRWYERKKAGLENRHGQMVEYRKYIDALKTLETLGWGIEDIEVLLHTLGFSGAPNADNKSDSEYSVAQVAGVMGIDVIPYNV